MAQASGSNRWAVWLTAWLAAAACTGTPAVAVAPLAAAGVDGTAGDAAAQDAAATDSGLADDIAATADAVAKDAVLASDSGSPAKILAPGPIQGELPDGIELSGAYTLIGAVVVPAGAVVKVQAGSTLTSPLYGISVVGTLVLKGTRTQPVTMLGPSSGPAWAGIHVSGKLKASHFEVAYATTNLESTATGTLELDHGSLHHAVKFNVLSRGTSDLSFMLVEMARQGAKDTFNLGIKGGIVTIEDSVLRNSPNECILAEGKCKLVARYNLLDTGHCGIHFNGTEMAEVRHNQFKGNLFGLMLFGLHSGIIQGNNFLESVSLEILSGAGQSQPVVATGNYWGDKKNFSLDGAQVDSSGGLKVPATDVGPRDDEFAWRP